MIVDSSAIAAIILDDPERSAFIRQILASPRAVMSAATYVEIGVVVDGRRDPVLSRQVDLLMVEVGVQVVDLTVAQARIAREAYRDFGRGSGHRAGLNLGDCYSYALAVDRGEPLLCKGDDFIHTDVRVAAAGPDPGGAGEPRP